MLAKNSGEVALTLEGHLIKRCPLHCKRNVIYQSHAWSRCRDARPLVSAKKSKTFDANKPASSGDVGSRFWKCLTSLSLNRLRLTRRFAVKTICVLKINFSFRVSMLDMRYTPCFCAVAARRNFSALCRDLASPLFLQFPSASDPMLTHTTIAWKRFETVGTFHRLRVFFQMHSGGLQVALKVTSVGKRFIAFLTV